VFQQKGYLVAIFFISGLLTASGSKVVFGDPSDHLLLEILPVNNSGSIVMLDGERLVFFEGQWRSELWVVLSIVRDHLLASIEWYLEDRDVLSVRHLYSILGNARFLDHIMFDSCSTECESESWYLGVGSDDSKDSFGVANGHGFEDTIVQMREDYGVNDFILPLEKSLENAALRAYYVEELQKYFLPKVSALERCLYHSVA
jgi:hypothetical protein